MVETKAYIVEYIGATVLSFHIFNSGVGGMSIGVIAGYMVMMMLAARLSGGHFHPGITVSMVVTGAASVKTFLFYWLMHSLGSLTGIVLYLTLSSSSFGIRTDKPFDPEVIWRSFLYTFLASMVVCIIYLLIATNPKSPRSAFVFCVPMAQYFVGTFGASGFNTLVMIGNIIGTTGPFILSQNWGGLIFSILGCLGGGLAGGYLYKTHLAN